MRQRIYTYDYGDRVTFKVTDKYNRGADMMVCSIPEGAIYDRQKRQITGCENAEELNKRIQAIYEDVKGAVAEDIETIRQNLSVIKEKWKEPTDPKISVHLYRQRKKKGSRCYYSICQGFKPLKTCTYGILQDDSKGNNPLMYEILEELQQVIDPDGNPDEQVETFNEVMRRYGLYTTKGRKPRQGQEKEPDIDDWSDPDCQQLIKQIRTRITQYYPEFADEVERWERTKGNEPTIYNHNEENNTDK